MTNFGVELFLNTFLHYARPPTSRQALGIITIASLWYIIAFILYCNQYWFINIYIYIYNVLSCYIVELPTSNTKNDVEETEISPDHDEFTGFVFKLQANLDPRHRDRMAFIRVWTTTTYFKLSYIYIYMCFYIIFMIVHTLVS